MTFGWFLFIIQVQEEGHNSKRDDAADEERFMQELEENPELRAQINIYEQEGGLWDP